MSAGHKLVLKPYRDLEFTVRVHADGDISGALWKVDRSGNHVANLAFAVSQADRSLRGDGSLWRPGSDENQIWIGSTCFELPAADVAKVAEFLAAHAGDKQIPPEAGLGTSDSEVR